MFSYPQRFNVVKISICRVAIGAAIGVVIGLPDRVSRSIICAIVLLLQVPTLAFSAANCQTAAGAPPCLAPVDPGLSERYHVPDIHLQSGIQPLGERVFHRDVDYQHPSSRLALVRYYNSGNSDRRFPFGAGWNMTYDIQLRRASEQQINLILSDGRIVPFTRKPGNHFPGYTASDPTDGELFKQGKHWHWRNNRNKRVMFKGPVPVQFTFGDSETLKLFYKDRRLQSVTDQDGNAIVFSYGDKPVPRGTIGTAAYAASSVVTSVALPDGRHISYTYHKENLVEARTGNAPLRRYEYASESGSGLLTGVGVGNAMPRHKIIYNAAQQPVSSVDHSNGQSTWLEYAGNKTHQHIAIKTSNSESAIYSIEIDAKLEQQRLLESRLRLCSDCPVITRRYEKDPAQSRSTAHHNAFLHSFSTLRSQTEVPVSIQSTGFNSLVSIRAGINSWTFKNRFDPQAVFIRKSDKRIVRRLLQKAILGSADSTLEPYASLSCAINGTQGNEIDNIITASGPDEAGPEPEACLNASNPQTKPLQASIAGAQVRETWVAGCLSYFDVYDGTGRGFEIEAAFADHSDFANAMVTASRFPVVDFLIDGTAVAVVSRDLTSASYSNPEAPNALFLKLVNDARQMYEKFLLPLAAHGQISATQGGLTTTISSEQVQVLVFELVIQHNTATAGQIEQIRKAAAYMLKTFGIVLNIIEIP